MFCIIDLLESYFGLGLDSAAKETEFFA